MKTQSIKSSENLREKLRECIAGFRPTLTYLAGLRANTTFQPSTWQPQKRGIAKNNSNKRSQ